MMMKKKNPESESGRTLIKSILSINSVLNFAVRHTKAKPSELKCNTKLQCEKNFSKKTWKRE